ncbi:MAG: hypothetical protein K8E66_05170, partial [Phycisphaerales bacterium]|nr:hypothetical protein [Phycisphaerales bacterium]
QYEIMQVLARDAIENDPFSGRAFSDLARTFENATDLARRNGQPEAAETYARTFAAHAQQALDRDPLNLGTRRMLGLARYKLGRTLADQNRHTDAVPAYETALVVLTDASDRDPDDIELRKDMMRAAYRLGISARRSDDAQKARLSFERAVAAAQPVAEAGALNTGDRNLVTFALNNLAAMAYDEQQGGRMVAYAETAVVILGEKPFLLARQHARGLALNGAYDDALDVLRGAMKPYLSQPTLTSAAQREFDELERLEAEYESQLEQQPGFDEPVP